MSTYALGEALLMAIFAARRRLAAPQGAETEKRDL